MDCFWATSLPCSISRPSALKLVFGFVFLQLFAPLAVSADFIRLTISSTAEVNAEHRQVIMQYRLLNEGTAMANDLAVEIPRLNQSHIVAEQLAPAETAEIKLEFSFDELGLKIPGLYNLPARITYRDANFYGFSAPHVDELRYNPLPAQSVSAAFGAYELSYIIVSLRDSTEELVRIRNLAKNEVSINRIEVFGPTEIGFAQKGVSLPKSLAAGATLDVPIEMKNFRGILGSKYNAVLLVEGTNAERHFTSNVHFRIDIAESWLGVRFWWTAIAVVIAAIMLFSAIRRKKQKT